jgi:signal transduction histidine kinase
MKEMAAGKRQILLTLIFLIVLIPLAVLSWFAFRTVTQEEMVQRRRLEDSLFLEIDQANSLIQFYLKEAEDDLYNSLEETIEAQGLQTVVNDPSSYLEIWASEQNLAGRTFLLREDRSIAYPLLDDSSDNLEADLFHWRYLNFFAGQEPIPVYSSIVDEYQDEILLAAEEEKSRRIVSAPKMESQSMAIPEAEQSEEVFLDDELSMKKEEQEMVASEPVLEPAPAPVESKLSSTEAPASAKSVRPQESAPAILNKQAAGAFESDELLQDRVYGLAEEEGQQYLQRNVLPTQSLIPREEEPQTVVRSVYMESTRYFEEIIADRDYGIIPRLFDSAFILLFWSKQGDYIVGCEINMTALEDRLVQGISTPANGIRYLNILDNGGRPLVPFNSLSGEDWRRPFVAKEISEILPYWETAILLRSPEEFQRQIESSRYLMTLMIISLGILVLAGITTIYQLSSRALRRGQQRVSFVTNVSHELKTPLTSIRLYSEMLTRGFQDDAEKVARYSSYISSESQRLTRLINNVLDFAKLEKGTKVLNLAPVDLNRLAREIHADLTPEYTAEGVDFSVETLDEEALVQADREAIVQVVLNLLSNSLKYSQDKKKITLSVEKNAGGFSLTVKDRGMGIPRKHRKKIFREFYRVDDSITSAAGGTGLGLPIARNIMRNHGGDLIYTPHTEGGSCFTMIFNREKKR